MSNPVRPAFTNKRSTMFHIAGLSLLAVTLLPSAFAADRSNAIKSNVINAIVPPSTMLTVTPGTSSVNEYTVLTLTAQVGVGSTGITTGGTVNFYDSTVHPTLIGTAQLNSIGVAVLKYVPGALYTSGSSVTHNITAAFLGTTTPAVVASTSTAKSVKVTSNDQYLTTGFLTATPTATAGTYNLTDLAVFLGYSAPTGSISFNDSLSSSTLISTTTFGTATNTFLESPLSTGVASGITVTTGDFNGDGYPDLVYTNGTTNTISVSLNKAIANGNAALTLPTFSALSKAAATGNTPLTLTTGDFNADGKLDVAVANLTDGTVSILLGNNDGTFGQSGVTPPAPVSVGSDPFSLVASDFNHDGKLDLAVANLGGGTVSILFGVGNGNFTTNATLTAGGLPEALAVDDFNGDGNPDLVVANGNDGNVYVFLGSANGTFSATPAHITTGSNPVSIATGDFNQDGKIDFAVLSQNSPGSVGVFLGDGSGTKFTEQAGSPYAVGSYPYGLIAGDLLGKGNIDLAVSNFTDGTISVLAGTSNHTGNFTVDDPFASNNFVGLTGLAAADFNGDGRMDIAFPNLGTGGVPSSTTNVLLGASTYSVSDNAEAFVGAGPHNLTASYASKYGGSPSGYDPYDDSTTASVPVTGATGSRATTLTGSITQGSGSNRNRFTLKATLTRVSGSTPTGIVTFFDNGVAVGSANLTSGSASFTETVASGSGSHVITANYGGDATFAPLTGQSIGSFTY